MPRATSCQIFEPFFFPFPGVLEFGESEAGLRFASAREKLLHLAFYMGLERVQFPGLGGNQLVHGAQAVGDFLLFGEDGRKRNQE